MDKTESLSHTRWECKYHIVFIPKRRRRTLESFVAILGRYSDDWHRRRRVGWRKVT
jgi:REP element-mobilizing transposase RayT